MEREIRELSSPGLPELLCQTGERAYTHLTLKQPTKLLHKYRQAETSIKTNKDEEEVEVPKAHFLGCDLSSPKRSKPSNHRLQRL